MTAAITDRELLELAGKEAGYLLDFDSPGDPWFQSGLNTRPWNPLVSDGDALRLASALSINIDTAGQHPAAVFFHPDKGRFVHFTEDPAEQGIMTATRRAIVRAAAELARVRG